ncbi:MAG TPA: hypothetical protein VII06_43345 [Chloroflexota bacterium]|jgi:hypothetical protein
MQARISPRPAIFALVALGVVFGSVNPMASRTAGAADEPSQRAFSSQAVTAAGAAGRVAAAAANPTPTSGPSRPNPSALQDRVSPLDGRGIGAVLNAIPTSTPTRTRGGSRILTDPPILLTAIVVPPPGSGPGSGQPASPTATPTVRPTQSPTAVPTASPPSTQRPSAPAPSGDQCGDNGGTGGAGGAGGDCAIIINEVTQVTQVTQPIVGAPPVVVERPVYVDRPVVVAQPAPVQPPAAQQAAGADRPVAQPAPTPSQPAADQPASADATLAQQVVAADDGALPADQPAAAEPAAADPAALASDAVPCPAPFGLPEPVQFPAVIDGVLVHAAPFCQAFPSEPADACATSYYFYEPDSTY